LAEDAKPGHGATVSQIWNTGVSIYRTNHCVHKKSKIRGREERKRATGRKRHIN
jgi:hypothetical protein